jgi:hypothetical protein
MRACACVLVWICLTGPLAAQVELVAKGRLPEGSDLSGLAGKLDDGTLLDRLGGHGSALAYTGQGQRYLLLADRGPKDGALPFPCRFHEADIRIDPKAGAIECKLIATHLLRAESGQPLCGQSAALAGWPPLRFDPEGIARAPGGRIYVSEEYGPRIVEFSRDGKWVRDLPVPAHFGVKTPHPDEKEELKRSAAGRWPNRGLEGLTLLPDGKKLVAALQSPLLQDGGRQGRNVRLLEIDLGSGRTREFIYQLEAADLGLSEILAVDAQRFLVIERDGKMKARRGIYLIQIDETTSDVSGVLALPAGTDLGDLVPARKRLLIDLLAPEFGLARDQPEKIEGLAFGPDLPDGRKLLLVTTDNDFREDQASWVYAFALDPRALSMTAPESLGDAGDPAR